MTDDAALRALIDAASVPYRAAGRFAWRFARGKLGGDPAFAAILAQGLLAGRARILDLGCGRGLLASWLLAARDAEIAGRWPRGWPQAPAPERLLGVELDPREVARARAALGERLHVVHGDIGNVDYATVDAIVMLDVLHYNDYAAQEAVLARARAALSPGGVLLLRVGDAEGGVGFGVSKLVDRAVVLVRQHRLARLWCRPAREWHGLLARLGFSTSALPMSAGTPFSNVLLVGRLP
ncbi:MAG: class I SAM-dependent methyltransferase [Steroidobacteraceae bacterium]